MKQVSVVDAKSNFNELLRRVGEGERFIVTHHGRPVAQLLPPDLPSHSERKAAIDRIREIGSRNTLDGVSLKELADEGRV